MTKSELAEQVPDRIPPGVPPEPGDSTADRVTPSEISPHMLVPDRAANARLATLMSEAPTESEARLSVSVLALDSGRSASFGNQRFDTASIVKVDVLAALLLKAQDEGRQLTVEERADAELMIRMSDNEATDAMWARIDGASGLEAANARLGLTATVPGADGAWGLTQTTSADQLALLRTVYAADSPLEAASQEYLHELMGTVIDEQRWGISAAADPGGDAPEGFALKNGWLPRSETGLWDVNSIGWVSSGGHEYLIAVVSDGHSDHATGIAAVEWAAQRAVESLAEDSPPVT
ncbi:serine hydrolase [Streptomyces sedi]|uniref:Serine hydrolase n=1 Tax=Streptomyces sedi TaxID=555059 RepID=A0A5C4V260_9ACTN|nr:serine hydrolase [Streptomyces sedi]TNM29793.1 serine hydrolase [Streptomyces sedi]